MEDIKWNAAAKLRKIPKEAFCRCFQQWKDWWSKCVCVCVCARACACICHAHVTGPYFEGDYVSIAYVISNSKMRRALT
jgi:hypothetical protein